MDDIEYIKLPDFSILFILKNEITDFEDSTTDPKHELSMRFLKIGIYIWRNRGDISRKMSKRMVIYVT